MDEHDTESLNDTSDVAGQDVMRFSMTQDNFIEDSPLAMARVIWTKLHNKKEAFGLTRSLI